MNKKVAIIGGGPAGALAAIFLAQQSRAFDITVFDVKKPLSTLLPTGGGRCNLTYFEPDNRELVKFYPRGEKFLLSVFSQFNALNTIEFFESIGIDTFVQEDSRVFPTCESSKEVSKILNYLLNKYEIHVKNELVTSIKQDNTFIIETESKKYNSDIAIIATGGKGNGFKIAKDMGHTIIEPKAALAPLELAENEFYSLSGLTLNKITLNATFEGKKIAKVYDDMLFTHNSISGPAIFKISSICAYTNFSKEKPLKLHLNSTGLTEEEIKIYITELIEKFPNRSLKNAISQLLPHKLGNLIINKIGIDQEKRITHLTKEEKNKLAHNISNIEMNVISKSKGKEIVTAGGIALNEINSKTMESKIIKDLYFCGEVVNIDGFTGGFNLQSCWSTAFVAANAIIKN
ncbi:MAG: aminoacetone oxidase family FAD-binding enzyme [Candidatus Gastranaerophilales bacterium]|nr:aminoacetone oxidase family FAD-binding enzyme [Candidatus Gastranaerophilales bacterium]